jgi:hypothetical protein
MVQQLNREQQVYTGEHAHAPCVTLILPFEPTMSSKPELVNALDNATDKIANELMENYPADEAMPVIDKLRTVVKDLNYNTHKKSIAIFISRLFEKIYYLDLPLTEKIVIDDSFEIRELIYNKKETQKYLLAVLTSETANIYIGSQGLLIPIVVNLCDNITGCKKHMPGNCDEYLDKFLAHTDRGLSLLLKSYPLPLFVMGSETILSHYKALTHTSAHVIEYIPGSFDSKTELELHRAMEPYVADWRKVKLDNLHGQLRDAAKNKKLFSGIREVLKAASQKRVKLLVVERNYKYPDQNIFWSSTAVNDAYHAKDLVDEVIEKVLANGADVEFVDDGFLAENGRIALIEVYDPI